MLRRLGPVELEDEGNGVYGVVVELAPLAAVDAPVGTSSPVRLARSGGRPTPLLHAPHHRHELRTRDQVCPWFH